jgi:hypothetical protein
MVPLQARMGEERKVADAQGATVKPVMSRRRVENFGSHTPYNVAWAEAVERQEFGAWGRSNKQDNGHMKAAAASGKQEEGGD